jgi:hypothetical protein
MIPLGLENNSKSCFWNNAFGFSVYSLHDINAIKAILHQDNTHLLASQKELLLWHQRLSHASVKWVQKLSAIESGCLARPTTKWHYIQVHL